MVHSRLLLSWLVLLSVCGQPPAQPGGPELSKARVLASPPGAFEIEGVAESGGRIEDLPDALRAHRDRTPGRAYEVVSEWKLTPATTGRIRTAFREAGCDLRHLWVPADEPVPESSQGPHGPGFVDALK